VIAVNGIDPEEIFVQAHVDHSRLRMGPASRFLVPE
jgi:hypothetical protein